MTFAISSLRRQLRPGYDLGQFSGILWAGFIVALRLKKHENSNIILHSKETCTCRP